MSDHLFLSENRLVEGGARVLHVGIPCSRCSRVDWAKAPNAGFGRRIFKTKGWLIGSRAGKHVCPSCRAPKRPDLTPAQRRAAYCRIEGMEPAAPAPSEPVNPVMAEKLAPVLAAMTAEPEEPPMAAEPPRQPSQADNRRILDALTAHYDEDAARYRKAFSDEALAKALDMPRAWIADVRERFYGPDVNEATAERDAKVRDALDLAEAAVKRLTEMALEAERIGANLRSQTKTLLTKGAA